MIKSLNEMTYEEIMDEYVDLCNNIVLLSYHKHTGYKIAEDIYVEIVHRARCMQVIFEDINRKHKPKKKK